MMGLTCSLLARPRLTVAMGCTVCRTYMDPVDKSLLVAKLFGAKRYIICAGCGTEITDSMMHDRNYRARWRRKAAKLQ